MIRLFQHWHDKSDTGLAVAIAIWHENMSDFKRILFLFEFHLSLFGKHLYFCKEMRK